MDLELFARLSRYPFAIRSKFYDSIELKQNKTCTRKCTKKDCLTLLSENTQGKVYRCSQQYDNMLFIAGDMKVVINGIILDSNEDIPKGRKEVRNEWIVETKSLLSFLSKIEEVEKHLVNKMNENVQHNLSMFHDFKTSMAIMYNCTQQIINDLYGTSFETKLERSGDSYKSLYQALHLITSQLGMIDVVINPQSIKFGTKKDVNLYKLFDKMVKLFEHIGNKRKITLSLERDGQFFDNIQCYESIEFIPLILLDNAIKYALEETTVFIKFTRLQNKIKVSIENCGPVVDEHNKDKIFEKFFRDNNGIEFSRKGVGMGLWIAQTILQAHGTKLIYFNKRANEKYGLNFFEFQI